jgi:glucose-6-phosphate 1-epimerase
MTFVSKEELPVIKLTHSSGAEALISPYGAHVLSWKTADGIEQMFLSEQSQYSSGSPIRGGVPVIFPQFGPGALPAHGFARTALWTPSEIITGYEATSINFTLSDNESTIPMWDYRFTLDLEFSITENSLYMVFTVQNNDIKPFLFTCALHTYFLISDINKSSVSGLKSIEYIDKMKSSNIFKEEFNSLIINEEMDRIYIDAPNKVVLHADDDVTVEKMGFPDIVVWNPWIKKSKNMPDFGDDEYLHMICIEAGAMAKPISLIPGEIWDGSCLLSIK